MGYIFLFLNIALTVVCQIMLKWRLNRIPIDFKSTKATYQSLLELAQDYWIISAVLGTFLSSFLWILTLSKLELSVAYPFSVFSYVAVVVISHFLLGEQLTPFRLIGVVIICVGILMIVKK